jgi:hypothetical protein
MPTTPRPDSRRRFLKQLGGGLGLLPVTAALGRGADRQPDVGSWDAVRAQFPFEEAMVPMNAGNLCPSPTRVVRRRMHGRGRSKSTSLTATATDSEP